MNPGHVSPLSFICLNSLIADFKRFIFFFALSIDTSHSFKFSSCLSTFLLTLVIDTFIINLVMKDEFAKNREAIADGLRQIKELSERETEIRQRISKISRLVTANIDLLPESEQQEHFTALEEAVAPSGLKEAVLRITPIGKPVSAASVRDALIKTGYDFSGQSNPLASIHTTLRRLAAQGKFSTNTKGDKMLFFKVKD